MRLLVVTNTFPTAAHPSDGIFVKRQVEALAAGISDLRVRVCFVDTVRGKWRYLSGCLTVLRAVREHRPDLLHIHYGLVQLPCFAVFRLPRVVTFHGSDLTIGWQRRISTGLLRSRTGVVVVSEPLRAFLNDPNQALTIACGVDTKRFSADRVRARLELGIDPEEVLVLFGAHPSRAVKRHDRFMEVAELLRARLPSVRLSNLSDVDVADVPKLMAAADVLVLTSDREGSPVVTKEALCCGTRVVSTPVGDVSDQLRGFSGCRVSGWTACELASSVLDALAEPAPDHADAARRFDLSIEVRALQNLYLSMVTT